MNMPSVIAPTAQIHSRALARHFDRLSARFDRGDIENAIEILIARLDTLDGDPDCEPNGDELDGTAAEDDFYRHSLFMAGPGCPLSDPDSCPGLDDIGTAHRARRKIGFDGAYGIRDDDAEDSFDREECYD